jgi:hypothetical protein
MRSSENGVIELLKLVTNHVSSGAELAGPSMDGTCRKRKRPKQLDGCEQPSSLRSCPRPRARLAACNSLGCLCHMKSAIRCGYGKPRRGFAPSCTITKSPFLLSVCRVSPRTPTSPSTMPRGEQASQASQASWGILGFTGRGIPFATRHVQSSGRRLVGLPGLTSTSPRRFEMEAAKRSHICKQQWGFAQDDILGVRTFHSFCLPGSKG